MAKPTFTRLSSLVNGVTAINGVITEIETAFQNTLSRDGSSPNTLTATLDANSQKIVNLPTPSSSSEPVTLGYLNSSGIIGPTGATGPAAWTSPVAWASSQVYTATAPASCVTYNGETYVCSTAHTSTGTFDAGKFTKIAAKGASGTGSGDLLSTNNLSDLANATTARTNLGLGTAATIDTGTTANKIVQLDASAKLPAIDGSQLTNLPSSSPSPTTGSTNWVKSDSPTLANITLSAGTASLAPAVLTSGTNLTTAAAGSVEYNGKTLMFTPIGTQRGIVPGYQFFRLDAALAGANGTSAQSLFGVGCTLSASTVYGFEIFAAIGKSAGTTSHNVSFGFGGTATLTSIYFTLDALSGVPSSTGVVAYANGLFYNNLVRNSATATQAFETATAAVISGIFVVRGIVSVNAGGTFIPQYTLSAAPGGAYSTMANSYMKVFPISASGANTNIGTWA